MGKKVNNPYYPVVTVTYCTVRTSGPDNIKNFELRINIIKRPGRHASDCLTPPPSPPPTATGRKKYRTASGLYVDS